MKNQHDRRNFPSAIDNTDWLKIAAIILVSVDHFGYFFMEDDLWWSVFGRLAAPVFFFLMGYAKTRTVPLHWIWIGVILTLLESWNADWAWVVPNIFLSFIFIRLSRPYVKTLVQHYGWIAFTLLVAALFAVSPIAAHFVDYGAGGWLWALFGLYQRMYVDGKSVTEMDGAVPRSAPPPRALLENAGLMRLPACLVAALFYIWQEQKEYAFPQIHLAIVIFGVGVLSLSLCLFLRGPSRIQPSGVMAVILCFVGRHTLEIYAIQLAGAELLIKLVPDLAP